MISDTETTTFYTFDEASQSLIPPSNSKHPPFGQKGHIADSESDRMIHYSPTIASCKKAESRCLPCGELLPINCPSNRPLSLKDIALSSYPSKMTARDTI